MIHSISFIHDLTVTTKNGFLADRVIVTYRFRFMVSDEVINKLARYSSIFVHLSTVKTMTVNKDTGLIPKTHRVFDFSFKFFIHNIYSFINPDCQGYHTHLTLGSPPANKQERKSDSLSLSC